MDVLEIYNRHYNKVINIAKEKILAEFKSCNDVNRPFTTISNNIIKIIQQYREENYSRNLTNNYSDSYKFFNNRYIYYKGEGQDVIKWILEREVANVLTEDKLLKFVRLIAINESLDNVYNHFRNYNQFYELIYDTKSYKYLYLQDNKDIAQPSSKEYNEMMDIRYPDRIKERAFSDLRINVDEKISMDKAENLDANNKILDSTIPLINDFTEDERMLIISVFFNLIKSGNASEVQLPSFMKFIKIAGLYEDLSIFYKKPPNKTSYTKAIKGIDYYSGKNQIRIINSTLTKLDPFDLSFISEALNKEKRRILS